MEIHSLAGHPAPPEMLIDVAKLERAYYERRPDFSDPNQRVLVGTSGDRGTAVNGTFAEAHILAIKELAVLKNLSPELVEATEPAGVPQRSWTSVSASRGAAGGSRSWRFPRKGGRRPGVNHETTDRRRGDRRNGAVLGVRRGA